MQSSAWHIHIMLPSSKCFIEGSSTIKDKLDITKFTGTQQTNLLMNYEQYDTFLGGGRKCQAAQLK